ncbi:MAG: hypothetical protein KF842_06790 [Caulobacter sp.]|nr:hypothetical protein [Caulobacter sp.]
MPDFLDHLAAADAAIVAHVFTPGAVRPVVGDDLDPVGVCIEQPAEEAQLQQGRLVRTRPVAWLSRAEVAALARGDLVEGEGRRWKIASAPTRPGDGRFWRAEVEDQGLLS